MAKKVNKIKSKAPKTAKGHARAQKSSPITKKVGTPKLMGAKGAKKPQTKSAPLKVSSKTQKPAKVVKPIKVAAIKHEKAQKADKNAKIQAKSNKSAAPVAAGVDLKGKAVKAIAAVVAPLVEKLAKGKAKGKAGGAKAGPQNLHNDRMCRESGCENLASTKGYCRLDYIKNWKKIKRKEMILKEGKLNQYIEELVSKYPDKYIEVIRQDLSTEVNFTKVIHDLELDESIDDLDYDGDSIDSLIGSIKKEEEDFGDTEF